MELIFHILELSALIFLILKKAKVDSKVEQTFPEVLATEDEYYTVFDAKTGMWLFQRYSDHPDMVEVFAHPEKYKIKKAAQCPQ